MDKWHNRVKKLALAYETGWEYRPEEPEAGSVLTDIFLEMMGENREQFRKIWEKQELEFLNAVPVGQEKAGLLKSELSIKAPEGANGKWLPGDSKTYMALEDGSLLWFSTVSPLQLTTASLKYAVYEKGLFSWQAGKGEKSVVLFSPSGQELAHPVFKWRFSNLCNGMKQFRFRTEFPESCGGAKGCGKAEDCGETEGYGKAEDCGETEGYGKAEGCGRGEGFVGTWTITDGRHSYALKWEDTLNSADSCETISDGAMFCEDVPDGAMPSGSERGGIVHCGNAMDGAMPGEDAPSDTTSCGNALDSAMLCGDTPGFAENLQDTEYEITLEISYEQICHREEQNLSACPEWLCAGFSLKKPAMTLEAEICITEDAVGDGKRVLPFGYFPEEASCCYLACDQVLAGGQGEFTLHFTESYEREDKLPPERPKEYEKIYKKYPWLQQTEQIADWAPQKTVWEYFNGNVWCSLPESRQWNTGCAYKEEEKKERSLHWRCPEDMIPCSIDGEEHFYIRLRAIEVNNSYAAYYRKYIPVLENIRFSVEETVWEYNQKEVPDLSKIGQEKMYLGFDADITPDNRWYAEYPEDEGEGSGIFSFHQKQIAGWGRRFGESAFWVELTRTDLQETLGLRQTVSGLVSDAVEIKLTANYAEVLQIPDSGEMEETATQEIEILQGTAFCVETAEMGVVDAVSVAEAYYNRKGAPCQAGWKKAENFFVHFGKLLTPMDIEVSFAERYPAFCVNTCRFEQASKTLTVEVSKREGFPEEAFDKGKLKEVQEWLEGEAHDRGSLWLQDCHVKIDLAEE